MKLRTSVQLQDFADKEFSWRLKEIADLKVALVTSSAFRQRSIIRATIPLLYAHWEGFIKALSEGYLNFVQNQRLKFNELTACLVVFGAKKHIVQLSESRKAIGNIAAVKFFTEEMTSRSAFELIDAIDTEANLSSAVFDNIALSIGIDPLKYQTKYNLIDSSLLKRRNMIAHGEFLDLSESDCRGLCDEVILLLRTFKNDIENAVANNSYRR